MTDPTDEKTDDGPLEETEKPIHERIFELYEAKIPGRCERCKLKRPRSVLLKKMIDSPQTLAFVCAKCADVIKRQGAEVARRVQETLEAQGADVSR